eukprot:4852_1
MNGIFALVCAIVLSLRISRVFGQVDCSCGSSVEKWQCTDDDGNTFQGGKPGYTTCVEERSDIWDNVLDCKYCYKCTGSAALGECECDVQENCTDVFIICGVIILILGIAFLIWQGFILMKFFQADGEWKDVWRICGCFILGLVCVIIGLLMIADQGLWFGIFS